MVFDEPGFELGEVKLCRTQIAQDALALFGRERVGDLAREARGALAQAGDARQVFRQALGGAHGRRRLAARVEAFEKEHGIFEQTLARRAACVTPGRVQTADLAARQPVLGHGTGQAQARPSVGAAKREEMFHRRVRRQLAPTQQVLDLFR